MSDTKAVPELPPAQVITTIPELEELALRLAGSPQVAVDLESDSFYTYHPKVCLLQLTSEGEDYVVDPLAVKDMSPLGPLFRDPGIEKIFHAADYDIQCLKRDYGFQVQRIFDTAAAARLLGMKELGLAALIKKHFLVTLSKKLQRAHWGKRPLSEEQIEYARCDTHYLPALRDRLWADLEEKGLGTQAHEEFERLAEVPAEDRVFNPDDFWRLPGARSLKPKNRAVLKELFFFREKTAAELDKAPFRVLPQELLVRLAAHLPQNLASLAATDGMTPYLFQRFGKDIVEAIHHGLTLPPIEEPPKPARPHAWDPTAALRYQALKSWRKAKAAERGVEPIVILKTDELRALCQAPALNPDPESWLTALPPTRRALYGEELLKLLPSASSSPEKPPPRRRRGRRRGG